MSLAFLRGPGEARVTCTSPGLGGSPCNEWALASTIIFNYVQMTEYKIYFQAVRWENVHIIVYTWKEKENRICIVLLTCRDKNITFWDIYLHTFSFMCCVKITWTIPHYNMSVELHTLCRTRENCLFKQFKWGPFCPRVYWKNVLRWKLQIFYFHSYFQFNCVSPIFSRDTSL
jgi:hypothetical protein